MSTAAVATSQHSYLNMYVYTHIYKYIHINVCVYSHKAAHIIYLICMNARYAWMCVYVYDIPAYKCIYHLQVYVWDVCIIT